MCAIIQSCDITEGAFTKRGNIARLPGSDQGCRAFKFFAFSASPREIGLAPNREHPPSLADGEAFLFGMRGYVIGHTPWSSISASLTSALRDKPTIEQVGDA
jgi:hypothetical protein